MSLDIESGTGSDNQPGGHLGVDQRNARSNEGKLSPLVSNSEPSFETQPSELEPFNDTAYEFIKLKDRSKAPLEKSWPDIRPLSCDQAQKHLVGGGNVGIRLKSTDLVIDVDPRNFANGDNPLDRLGKELGLKWADFATVETGSGGWHIFMIMPAGTEIKNKLAEYQGIDFKSLGAQVVAPGSVHPNGKCYRFDPLTIPITETAQAPIELVQLLHRESGFVQDGSGGDRSPDELRAMLNGLDVEEYREHDRWLEIMMASHHATGGAGRQEFLEWSTSDPVYSQDEGIIGTRWDSLNADRIGRSVTEQTIFDELYKAGRSDLIPKNDASEDFSEDSDFELSLYAEPDAESVEGVVAKMNQKYCAVLDGDFSIYMTEYDDLYDPPRQVMTRLGRSALRHYHENNLISIPDQKSKKNVADVWLQHPSRRSYPGITMDPSNAPTEKLNLWQGWAVKTKKGDWSLMKELICSVLCDGDENHAGFVLRWIAFMVQKPEIRPEVAIAFRGNEGTGKSTLGRALMELSGRHGITVSSPKQLAGNFNAHLRNAVFVFADEALWPGNKEAEGTLKQLVTEPVISFEPKGKDVFLGRNFVHLMLASNEDWIVPAGKDARRFAVFDVSDERRNDHKFFGELHKQMQNGGYAAMLHDLLEMDLGDWHPAKHVPQTQALADQKIMSLDHASKFWMEVLAEGRIDLIDRDQWLEGPHTLRDERETLRSDFDAYLKRNRIYSTKATNKALASAGRCFGLRPVKLNGNRDRGWVLPPLAEARKNFEDRFGIQGLFD